jgi:hypothetical protein
VESPVDAPAEAPVDAPVESPGEAPIVEAPVEAPVEEAPTDEMDSSDESELQNGNGDDDDEKSTAGLAIGLSVGLVALAVAGWLLYSKKRDLGKKPPPLGEVAPSLSPDGEGPKLEDAPLEEEWGTRLSEFL